MTKLKFGAFKTVYRGKIFVVKERPVMLPNGKKITFEYCLRRSSVSTLAFNKKNELLMIREFRPGYKQAVWFLPSGKLDVGDTPKKAALRELREETGFTAKIIKLVAHRPSSSSTIVWDTYIFAAKNLVASPLPPEPGEEIEPIFVPFKKAVKMALNGTIENEFIAYNIIRFNEMIKRGEFKWVIK